MTLGLRLVLGRLGLLLRLLGSRLCLCLRLLRRRCLLLLKLGKLGLHPFRELCCGTFGALAFGALLRCLGSLALGTTCFTSSFPFRLTCLSTCCCSSPGMDLLGMWDRLGFTRLGCLSLGCLLGLGRLGVRLLGCLFGLLLRLLGRLFGLLLRLLRGLLCLLLRLLRLRGSFLCCCLGLGGGGLLFLGRFGCCLLLLCGLCLHLLLHLFRHAFHLRCKLSSSLLASVSGLRCGSFLLGGSHGSFSCSFGFRGSFGCLGFGCGSLLLRSFLGSLRLLLQLLRLLFRLLLRLLLCLLCLLLRLLGTLLRLGLSFSCLLLRGLISRLHLGLLLLKLGIEFLHRRSFASFGSLLAFLALSVGKVLDGCVGFRCCFERFPQVTSCTMVQVRLMPATRKELCPTGNMMVASSLLVPLGLLGRQASLLV